MSLLLKFLQNFQGYLQGTGLFDYKLPPWSPYKKKFFIFFKFGHTKNFHNRKA